MKLKTALISMGFMFLLAHLLLTHPQQQAEASSPFKRKAVAGEFIIKLDKGVTFDQIRSKRALQSAYIKQRFPILSQRIGFQYLLIKVADNQLEQLQQMPHILSTIQGIAAACPNTIHHLARRPNDPLFNQQWGLHNTGQAIFSGQSKVDADIDAPEAWDIATGSDNVVVAVLDTGIDTTHEDLKYNLWTNTGEIPGNNQDDDSNGVVDDYHGYDFAADNSGANNANPKDIDGHGTHVAGTIAARGNNGTGVAGVCWRAKIMALKIYRPDETIVSSDELEAFEYILTMKSQHQVNIVAVNCSYGGGSLNTAESDAIAALGQAGIAVCCAAGNGDDNQNGVNTDIQPFYPASYKLDNVIAVAASNEQDTLTTFSNFGAESVHIAAPGEAVISTVPMGSGKESAVISGPRRLLAFQLEYAAQTGGIKGFLTDCRLGYPQDFPVAVKGQVALIQRGEIFFSDKVKNAKAAGAAAVIIFNHSPGNFLGTLGSTGDWLPAVSISQKDGEYLLSLGMTEVTVINRSGNYDFLEGTSMATPHVSGAIALLASRFPAETMDKWITRVLLGADRIEALQDKCRSGGRLNVGSLRIQAPLNIQGIQVLNQSFTFTEYINHLTWQANPQNINIVKYHIYRVEGAKIEFLAEVGSDHREYLHRQVPRGSRITYAIQALDNQDTRGEPALITVQSL
jgi:subtilisin family serine protease